MNNEAHKEKEMKMQAERSDELWDIYDKNRIRTGQTHRRGDPLPEGAYHLVIHVCIFNQNNQLLIQQRQPFKKGWPNMWDLSVGGSAIAGDTSQTAAEREVAEELGLKIDLSNTRPQFTIHFRGGFDDYYLIEQEVDILNLSLQQEEVQQVKWVTKEEALRMVEEGVMIPYYFLESLFAMRGNYSARIQSTLNIQFAEQKNIKSWMSLIDIIRNDFPGLETEESIKDYTNTLIQCVESKSAICALDGNIVVGILLFSREQNLLGCLAVHPEYRRKKIAHRMVRMMLKNMDLSSDVVVETFRDNENSGIAARNFYHSLGFEEGELGYSEDGYPTQHFIYHSSN